MSYSENDTLKNGVGDISGFGSPGSPDEILNGILMDNPGISESEAMRRISIMVNPGKARTTIENPLGNNAPMGSDAMGNSTGVPDATAGDYKSEGILSSLNPVTFLQSRIGDIGLVVLGFIVLGSALLFSKPAQNIVISTVKKVV